MFGLLFKGNNARIWRNGRHYADKAAVAGGDGVCYDKRRKTGTLPISYPIPQNLEGKE